MTRVKTSGEPIRADTGAAFVKARRVRSFDDVVEQVRSAVFDGTIGAGERLPSERELAEQFGVSRATLREALRALEASGIIEIRVGAHGGAFATEGAVERSAEALRQVYDVELAIRPDDALRFRASFHADNAMWARSDDVSGALVQAASAGSQAFLIALGESTGILLRGALSAAIEKGAGEARRTLSSTDVDHAIELLRRGRRNECRDHLFACLTPDDAGAGDEH